MNDLHETLKNLADYHDQDHIRAMADDHITAVEDALASGKTPEQVLNSHEGKVAAKFAEKYGPEMRTTTDYQESRQVGPDFDQLRQDAVERALDRFQEGETTPRVNTIATLKRLLKRISTGAIDDNYLSAEIGRLLNHRLERGAAADIRGASRVRGASAITEKLERAVRRGELDPQLARVMSWFARGNPELVEGLGLSIKQSTGVKHGEGMYNPASRVITLAKSAMATRAGVHEILHHLERMMPPAMQEAVRKVWTNAVVRELQTATSPYRKAFLRNALMTHLADDPHARAGLQDILAKHAGKLNPDDYRFLNPSEYWAETMAERAVDQYDARWTDERGNFRSEAIWRRTANWLKDALEHIKSVLGLDSKYPMIKAMDEIVARQDDAFRSPHTLQDVLPKRVGPAMPVPRGLGYVHDEPIAGRRLYTMHAQDIIDVASKGMRVAKALREALLAHGYDGLKIDGAGATRYVDFGGSGAPGPHEGLPEGTLKQDAMYSMKIPKTPNEAADAIGDGVREIAQPGGFLKSLFSRGADVKDTTSRLELWSKMTNQIAASTEGMRMKSLQLYTKLKGQQGMQKRQYERPVADLDTAIQALPAEERLKFERLERAATTAQIWPDRDFKAPGNEHLEPGRAPEHAALAQAYQDLSPAAKAVFQQTRKLFADQLAEKRNIDHALLSAARDRSVAHQQEIFKDAIDRGDTKAAAKAKKTMDQVSASFNDKIAEMDAKLREIKGPYSPNLRFGKFIVVAKSKALKNAEDRLEAGKEAAAPLKAAISRMRQDERHYVVTSDDRLSSALTRAEDLRKNGYEVDYPRTVQEHVGAQNPPGGLVADMQAHADTLDDRALKNAVKDLLAEFAARDLPEHHALMRQMHRENIAGASAEASRSIITAAQRNAHYMAALKFAPQLADTLRSMRAEGKELTQTHKSTVYEQISNEMAQRHLLDMQYSNTWMDQVVNGVNNLSYFYHLGLSPGFMVQQVLQPTMLTLPQMGAQFGVARTTAAMMRAYHEAAKLIVKSASGRPATRSLLNFDVSTKLHEPTPRSIGTPEQYAQERVALQYLLDHGALDMGREHDFSLTTHGNSPAVSRFKEISAWMPHYTEILNRLVTGLAGYRLAVESGMPHDQAVDYAHKMIDLTQINYSGENLPRMMRPGGATGSLVKTAMQFRRFQQAMVYLTLKNLHDSFASDLPPGDRGIAIKALVGQTVMMSLAVGMLATAFAFPIKLIASTVSKALGEPMTMDQVEGHFRDWLVDVTGGNTALARGLANGLPAMLGADISNQVGMGTIFNPVPYTKIDPNKPNDILPNLLMGVGGAPVGMVQDWITGLGELSNGNWKGGLAKLIPMKGIDNLIRAWQMDTEGLTNQKGVTIVPADKITAADVGMRAAGVSSSRLSDHYLAQSVKQDTIAAAQNAKGAILNQVLQSTSRGGPALPPGVLDQIRDFNDKYAKATGERLTGGDVVKEVVANRKAQMSQDEAGVAYSPRQQALKPEGRFAR